ncbi:MAG: DUF192 protein [Gammaproteobacteria bacterium]|nr:DUF192 protein [Gammaproteobacteria bacterium]
MNNFNLLYRIFLIFIFLAGMLGCSEIVRAESALEPLTIRTAAGKEISYQVEIADTNDSRRRGLMYRMEMPTNQGMLLDFGSAQKVAIWMKNTYLALDIIYIDAAGIITRIVPDAVPHSTALMPSDNKVRAVLEVNAGQADYHGISIGDRVLHHAFN